MANERAGAGGSRIVAVVGPTAAGKSDLSLDLAERLGGEIVNTDAMQVYRGMDVGTAKLPVADRRGVPHHLLDLLDVREPATVAQFQTMARSVVDDCRSRGVTPVLVGGSALYTRAVLDRFDFPGTDPAVRAGLEAELAAVGPAALHERLRGLDPAAADKVAASNGRRVVRALEVVALTGRPFSASLPEQVYFYDDAVQVGIRVPRPVLDERIELRVRRMWEAGLVEEVRRLADAGLREGRTASRALGYRQVRPRSRPTVAGSTPRSPSCDASLRTCAPRVTPSGPSASVTRSRRSRSPATPTRASRRCSTG